MCRSWGHFSLLRWILLIGSFFIFSMTKKINIEVAAWIINPDSSYFRNHISPLQLMQRGRTTSLQFDTNGAGGNEGYRSSQKKEVKQHQGQFFFNTTGPGLYYMSDDGDVAVVENNTVPVSVAPTISKAPERSATGTFGDIMSPTIDDADLLFQDGLVTSETYSLEEIYGISNPLDRMAVTANGNLQRLFSSFYDAPVLVEMVHCKRQKQPSAGASESGSVDATAIWDRRVLLKIFGNQIFCTADSVVEVHSREAEDLIESGKVGIGQIFRHFNILPEFTLLAAGPTTDGGFWRNYTLESSMVTCSIREVFCKGLWVLSPTTVEGSD